MTIKDRIVIWLREPLIHFLIAGFGVFLFSAWRGNSVDPQSRTITITTEQVQMLAQGWTQAWQRPPSQSEIDGMIADYIKEEVYAREAKRLGLDQDDPIIRRRLRSKMEFLEGAQVENAVPSEATLQAWLKKYGQKYTADAAYSFDQIYLGEAYAKSTNARLKIILAQLHAGAKWQGLGKSISLTPSLEQASKTAIGREFGNAFAQALAGQKQGVWVGPIASGYGVHIVRIRAVQTPNIPDLVHVRQDVENDWRAATLNARRNKAYQTLLDGYTIKIAKP
jgi:peptidyl-prolyl cis-trans isomerase C